MQILAINQNLLENEYFFDLKNKIRVELHQWFFIIMNPLQITFVG